ncbi:unnamed protein product [Chrysoparadoxa australica]
MGRKRKQGEMGLKWRELSLAMDKDKGGWDGSGTTGLDADVDASLLCSLEEIDGSAYEVIKAGNGALKMVPRGVDDVTQGKAEGMEGRGKKASKKRQEDSNGLEGAEAETEGEQEEAQPRKKARKKKAKKKKNQEGEEDEENSTKAAPPSWELSEAEATTMLPWSYSGVSLHPALLYNLHRLGFVAPTPIQSRTLPKALLSRKDVLGAAETGSGKTLAYGLPLLNYILERGELDQQELPKYLEGLVLCPTRELALQVTKHLKSVSEGTGVRIVPVVGGLAEVKQERQLRAKPQVVVATPGRLWELVSAQPYLRDLSKLRFLIIDEADRMLERGHYQELNKLFKLLSHAKVERNKKELAPGEEWMVEEGWLVDEEEEEDQEGGDSQSADAEVVEKEEATGPVDKAAARQTLIFSATLSLESAGRAQKKGRQQPSAAEGLEDIMKRVGIRGKPAIVDVSRQSTDGEARESTNEKSQETAKGGGALALPAGLTLSYVKSLQMEKDLWCYLFCTLYPGRTLVFVNAISNAKRLGEILTLLKVPARVLHAQMQQKQRLKSLEHFRDNNHSVLVATDVAARGLDIAKVQHVVHYDVARSTEVFIHRSGRTARAKSSGLALAIVSPQDESMFQQTANVLQNHTMSPFPFEANLVDRARERVSIACKIVKVATREGRTKATRNFFVAAAEESGLPMDDELERQVKHGKGPKEKAPEKVVKEEQAKLEALLRQPLHLEKRKLLPVAEALHDMEVRAQATALGDAKGSRRGKKKKARAR